jgi:8-oxo-dGTP pyrophosphatase MutT (NUDIX family)
MLLASDDPRRPLLESLRTLVPADAAEARDRDRIVEFVLRHPDPFDRSLREGHLTGSAIVVSADGTHTLLLHHRKLNRWLQPGGHGDAGERTGEEVALREAREETGIEGMELHAGGPRPLDVDVHDIPPHGDDPAHQHLDLRYLVTAPPGAALAPQREELHALRWMPWSVVGTLGPDPGLRRALLKAREATAPSAR